MALGGGERLGESIAKLFLIIERVFLCEGDVFSEALYDMELNDLLHCGTER